MFMNSLLSHLIFISTLALTLFPMYHMNAVSFGFIAMTSQIIPSLCLNSNYHCVVSRFISSIISHLLLRCLSMTTIATIIYLHHHYELVQFPNSWPETPRLRKILSGSKILYTLHVSALIYHLFDLIMMKIGWTIRNHDHILYSSVLLWSLS